MELYDRHPFISSWLLSFNMIFMKSSKLHVSGVYALLLLGSILSYKDPLMYLSIFLLRDIWIFLFFFFFSFGTIVNKAALNRSWENT